MKIVNTMEMKEIEELAYRGGMTDQLIIENVGIRGADFIENKILKNREVGEIVVLVGRGNNGADGLAIARHLVHRGHHARAFMLFPESDCKGDLLTQLKMSKSFGVKVSETFDVEELSSYLTQAQSESLVIDAILGTGVRLPLSNFLFDVITLVNQYASITVAIDSPSGLHGDSGAISSIAIDADYTLAIGLPKIGYYIAQGPVHCGEIEVIDAGIPHELFNKGDKHLLDLPLIKSMWQKRDPFAHKNSYGHLLVIGGSEGLIGAPIMAAHSAAKVGTGLVTVATWHSQYVELSARVNPEVMTAVIPERDEKIESVLSNLDRFQAIVIGPGLGRAPKAREALLKILNFYSGPLIIDADAINAINLKEDLSLLQMRKSPTILTPHIGEFARLLDLTTNDILTSPVTYLKNFVEQTGCALVLKSSCTLIGTPLSDLYVNYYPNDGLAKGGTGDTLAGIIGGMIATAFVSEKKSRGTNEHRPVYDALSVSVGIHSLAGLLAAKKVGVRSMSASDITNHLGEIFLKLDERDTL